MRITFNRDKRNATLLHRKLDFADAKHVFAGRTMDRIDDRKDYGEVRVVTVGLLRGLVAVIVWTQRGVARRIISMRKANAKEKALFRRSMD